MGAWAPRLRSADALLDRLAAAPKTKGARSGADLLTMLISIYGSKELFVNEYRLLLAGKLLRNDTYATGPEVATLELLKLRFGEAALHQCEIMVRDVDESKRLNNSVAFKIKADHAEANAKPAPVPAGEAARALEALGAAVGAVDATVVSEHFWPGAALEGQGGDDLTLHPKAVALLATYNATYCVLKKPRHLLWREALGSVDLELEFRGAPGAAKQVLPFSVSPLHATLILHFSDDDHADNEEEEEEEERGAKDEGEGGQGEEGKARSPAVVRRASELSELTGLPLAAVKRRMDFWVASGVVRLVTAEGGDAAYEALDEPFGDRPLSQRGGGLGGGGGGAMEDDEHEGGGGGGGAAVESRVLANFVKGMLRTQAQGLPVERIHNLLKMYTAGNDSVATPSPAALQQLLAAMMDSEVLDFADGCYRLNKAADAASQAMA